MTTVTICKDREGRYRNFICMGHAGYAKRKLFGQSPDILCAAVSALVLGAINSLEELAGERLTVAADEATGFIRCDFDGTLQEKSVFLMDALVFSLEGLSEEYGRQYLQIKFEEV